jgi:hypothetical protein
MALAVGTNWFHSILQLILCIDLHGLGLLARFVNKIFPSLSSLVSGLYMLYNNLYRIFLLLSPFDKAWGYKYVDLAL